MDLNASTRQLIVEAEDRLGRHPSPTHLKILSIEGTIGAGKSTVLSELQARDYDVYVEPIEEWTEMLNEFYTGGETLELALKLQVHIIESLVRRHHHILTQAPRVKRGIIMERSLQAAIYIFTENGAAAFPHTAWDEIRQWGHELIEIYETRLIKVTLDVTLATSVEHVAKRFQSQEVGEKREEPSVKYLAQIHQLCEQFSRQGATAFLVMCEKKTPSQIVEEIECIYALSLVMEGNPALPRFSNKYFVCQECDYKSVHLRQAREHFINVHLHSTPREIANTKHCTICDAAITRINSHLNRRHISIAYQCIYCDTSYSTEREVTDHVKSAHPAPANNTFAERESAFNRRVQTFETRYEDNRFRELETCFLHSGPHITAVLKHQLSLKLLLKFSLIYHVRYAKYDLLGNVDETIDIPLRSAARMLLLAGAAKVHREVKQCQMDLVTRHEQFLLCGSGWTLQQINSSSIELGKVHLSGGCEGSLYTDKIPSYKEKYLIDCPTRGDECFFNAVALSQVKVHALPPRKRALLAREYTKNNLKTRGIRTPVRLADIKKFERKNKDLDVSINVYQHNPETHELIPVHYSSYSFEKPVIHLLLRQEKHTMEHHYVFISDFHRFCANTESRRFHCGRCLNTFSTADALSSHLDLCSNRDAVKTSVPEPGEYVQFTAQHKKNLQGIIGTCDFEATLTPVSKEANSNRHDCPNCLLEDSSSFKCKHSTSDIHHQVPTTFSIVLCDNKGKIIYDRTESDKKNVMKKFFTALEEIESTFIPLLQKHQKKFDYSKEEQSAFDAAVRCYLCGDPFPFAETSNRKVRDHCHYNNEYLGAAHSQCNWKRVRDTVIPLYIHNFKNYDAQFILQGLKYVPEKRIRGIPFNMQTMRTLQIGNICFVDSIQLLPTSLSVLVDNLKSANHKFSFIDQIPYFAQFPHLKHKLLQKGVYPYEWASSVRKLLKTKVFPEKNAFYSHLKEEHISDEDYEHGKNVFSSFQCSSMLEYCHLYCLLDTVLLLEAISEFRNMIWKEFGLDCTRYISAPQLSYDCMLLTLHEPIELMTDPDMILMCEQNIRGGVSFVNERHVRLRGYAKGEDPCNKVQDQVLYVDANNLYSVAQMEPQPDGGYGWCTQEDLKSLEENIATIPTDYEYGFILECDLSYPSHLHEAHSSLPLMPEHVDFSFDDLSPYSQQSLFVLRGKEAHTYKASKLVTNLKDKKKYVLHYRNLQTYLRNGIVLNKIHRAIKFHQSKYIKPYIEMCTKKRLTSASKFEKDFWKLIANSLYGKYLQNNRKHFEWHLCQSSYTFNRYFNATNFKGFRILSEDCVIVFTHKREVKLDRLYATGFTILELSKDHMYRSWYEFMQPALGPENVSIVLTDTDSFILHVKNMSRNEMLDRLDPCMDFSNYPPKHPRFSNEVKAIPGYFKDENEGNYMTEVVALKAKCYITKVEEGTGTTEHNRVVCKGIGRKGRDRLKMQDFRKVLSNFSKIYAETYVIRSRNHQLYTQSTRKIALTTTDDKRFLLSCGKHTLPHGSHVLKRCLTCK